MSIGVEDLRVIWRDAESGRRHVVGHLRREADEFWFAYDESGVESAKRHGFRELLEFPQLGHVYRSRSLFPTFAQRVPSTARSDFAALMKAWGVTQADDPMEILARSRGRLATDRIELAADPDEADDRPTNRAG